MKNIFMAVLAVSSLPDIVLAQDLPHQHTELNEIVISASPLEESAAGVNQAVSVLSGEALHNAAAATIGETLQNEPGVTSSGFGPGVGKPVIRGQVGNRVKVMQDSVGTLDASSASGDHVITTEALVAKRIEVLRGPATLRYGNGAIGGVVNVIDNRIPDKLPEATTGAVEYRHNNANDQNSTVMMLDGAVTETPLGNWAWHFDALYRDSNDTEIEGLAQRPEAGENPTDHKTTNGYIANTDTQANTVTGGVSWIGDEGFVGISISETENLYGIPPGGNDHDEESELVRIDMEQTRLDLKAEWADVLPGFNLGRIRISHNDYEHTELEGNEKGTRFTNEAIEARVELLHQEIAGWTGAVGLQLEDRQFAAIGDEAFIPKSDIQNTGVFWVGETSRGDWSYELGLRLDRQTIDPERTLSINGSEISHNTQSLSLSSLWQITDEQGISLSFTRAQRAPSVEELLSNGPHYASESFDIGNANLDEETSHNAEIGYQYNGSINNKIPLKLSVNLFYNSIDDFIFQKRTGAIDMESELSIFQYQQEDATFRGIETSVEIPLTDDWEIELFGDYVRAKLDKSGDVPRIPPLRYGMALNYQQEQWNAGLRLTEVEQQNHAGDLESDTRGYTRLDGHLHYHLGSEKNSWLLFLKANNLLDEEIRNSTSFLREIAPEPSRSLELGVRMSF